MTTLLLNSRSGCGAEDDRRLGPPSRPVSKSRGRIRGSGDHQWPLLVGLRGASTLHFSGGRDSLDIIWDALDGVAEQAMTAEHRHVNRHQHIEYFPGDAHRSPNSVPFVIVADWPEPPVSTTP